MDVGAVKVVAQRLRAAYEDLAALPVDMLTAPEVLSVLDDLEILGCQLPTQWHRLLARLQVEATPKALGAKSWPQALSIRWRISTGEANRRLSEAEQLGPRHSVTGPTLDPVMPATAIAQSLGVINPNTSPNSVRPIRRFRRSSTCTATRTPKSTGSATR